MSRSHLGSFALVVTLAVGGLGACGDDDDPVASGDATTTTAPATTAPDDGRSDPAASCSAADVDASLEPVPDLPEPVADMRTAIARAASECDYDTLEQLAQGGTGGFTYSFGDGGQPAEYWRQREAEGEDPLRYMVGVLQLPPAAMDVADGRQFVWPSAFAYEQWDEIPESEIEALRALYSPEEIDRFEQFGGYIGYRVGITADGDWVFFVAGD